MTFRKIEDIPYSFLRNAALNASQYCPINDIYMDKEGGVCVTVNKELDINTIQRLMSDFNSEVHCPEYNIDYTLGNGVTYFYSKDGIDYRKL